MTVPPELLYRLEGIVAVHEPDNAAWSRWMATANRVVRSTRTGNHNVSTVFLGSDHGIDNVQLFETRVFGEPELGMMIRCATWDEASAQHERVVEEVRKREAAPTTTVKPTKTRQQRRGELVRRIEKAEEAIDSLIRLLEGEDR
jgi:hypothetical protein